MPTYTFTSPEGQTYEVNAPEGATPEQAYQYLQNQLGAAGAAPTAPTAPPGEVPPPAPAPVPVPAETPPEPMSPARRVRPTSADVVGRVLESPVGRFAGGLAQPVLELGAGLAPPGSEAREAFEPPLERARRPGGLARTLGRIGGEVALGAAVGGPAYRAARAMTAGTPIARHVAPLGAESAALGVTAGARLPEEGETRLRNAAITAALNQGLGTGISALSGALVPRMFPKSQAALREEASQRAVGVEPRLPLAVAAEPTGPTGKVLQWFHRQPLRALPGAGGVLRGQTEQFLGDWRESMFLRALPERARGQVDMPRARVDAETPVADTFRGISDWYRKEYSEILDPYNFRVLSGPNADRLARAYEGIPESGARREVTEKFGDYLQNLVDEKGTLSGSAVSSLKQRIRSASRKTEDADVASGWGDVLDALDDVVVAGIRSVNPSHATRYAELRGPYRNLVTLERAAARPGTKVEQFGPEDLYVAAVGKAKTETGERTVAQMRAPLQPEAARVAGLMEEIPKKQQAANVFQLGALSAMTGGGLWAAPGATAAIWGGLGASLSPSVQRYLMAATDPQRALARVFRTRAAEEAARAGRVGLPPAVEEIEDIRLPTIPYFGR